MKIGDILGAQQAEQFKAAWTRSAEKAKARKRAQDEQAARRAGRTIRYRREP